MVIHLIIDRVSTPTQSLISLYDVTKSYCMQMLHMAFCLWLSSNSSDLRLMVQRFGVYDVRFFEGSGFWGFALRPNIVLHEDFYGFFTMSLLSFNLSTSH